MLGLMSKRPVPQPVADAWLIPGINDAAIRRDLVKYCRTRFDSTDLVRATESLADFGGQVLVLWTRNPVMPERHARRLAELTGARMQWIDDAGVLVMLDQPQQTAAAIGEFLI